MEAVIVSIRANLLVGNARLEPPGQQREYTESEAKAAFDRMVKTHGW